MTNGIHLWTCAVLLGGAGLGLGQRAVLHHQQDDLDAIPPGRLDALLQAELDDIFEGTDPNELVDLEELKEEIMSALSDEGDDDDPAEAVIDFAELDAEMEEDETSVDAVVDEALSEVDQDAGLTPNASGFVLVSSSIGGGGFRTTRRLAVRQTKSGLRQHVYARR